MGRISRSGINLNTGKSALELNEGNVSKIFERCLAQKGCNETVPSIIFPAFTGFSKNDEKIIHFDKAKLEENQHSIEYLYGQLSEVHKPTKRQLSYADFITSYTGEVWTRDTETLLKFWYLGNATDPFLLEPFYAKDKTTKLASKIEPTLSPKDPNFESWWNEHRESWNK